MIKFKITLFWYRLMHRLGMKADEIYYIGGSEALPPPLSKEEEAVLLKKNCRVATKRSARC